MKKAIKILMILSKFAEDIFISIGLLLIITATFMINKIAGIYVLGFICLVIGLLITRSHRGGD